MTAARSLIAGLAKKGVIVDVEGGRLRCSGATAMITEEEKAGLTAAQAEIISMLTANVPARASGGGGSEPVTAETAAEFVAMLRRIGCPPRLDERGRFTVPAGPALTDRLEDAVRERRHEVLAFLQTEAGARSPLAPEGATPDPELASLVDRIGRQQQWLSQYAHEWSDEEWEKRRAALLGNLAAMDGEIIRRGEPVEQYGWTVNATGAWARHGEAEHAPRAEAPADELVRHAYRRIGETLPGGAVPWAEEHLPDLISQSDAMVERWEAAYHAGDLPALKEALGSLLAVYAEIASAFEAGQRAHPAASSSLTVENEGGCTSLFEEAELGIGAGGTVESMAGYGAVRFRRAAEMKR